MPLSGTEKLEIDTPRHAEGCFPSWTPKTENSSKANSPRSSRPRPLPALGVSVHLEVGQFRLLGAGSAIGYPAVRGG